MDNFALDILVLRDCIYQGSSKLISSSGLDHSLFVYLVYVERNAPVTMSAIGIDLHFDNAHSTRSIHSLVRLGYVARKRDLTDRRRIVVSLTVKGHNLIKSLADSFQKYSIEALKPLTDKEAKDLLENLHKVEKHLDAKNYLRN
jgi:DNA-binding MarR family transcriptional regulator